MSVFTKEAEYFLVESLLQNMTADEFETAVYVSLGEGFNIPIPKQYIDMEDHIVCDECRQLLNEPTYGDVWACDECGHKIDP